MQIEEACFQMFPSKESAFVGFAELHLEFKIKSNIRLLPFINVRHATSAVRLLQYFTVSDVAQADVAKYHKLCIYLQDNKTLI